MPVYVSVPLPGPFRWGPPSRRLARVAAAIRLAVPPVRAVLAAECVA